MVSYLHVRVRTTIRVTARLLDSIILSSLIHGINILSANYVILLSKSIVGWHRIEVVTITIGDIGSV
jgi:hypothetical protein